MSEEIPLFPVAGLTVGPVHAHGIVVIRPDFLSNLTQRPEEAHQGRTYALTPPQARYVVEQIQKALAALESGPLPGAGLPKH